MTSCAITDYRKDVFGCEMGAMSDEKLTYDAASPHSTGLLRKRTADIAPGLLVCAAAGGIAILAGSAISGLSAMLVAVVAGALWRNLAPVPRRLEPGIAVSAKKVLRWGVVLLGLQLSLPAIISLGPGVLAIVICAVGITFFSTLLIGRAFGIDRDLRLLIAGGFSICGAAAVAGVQGAVRATEEKVAAAVALVVLYGTLMIPLMPMLVRMLGLGTGDAGTLIGGSTHEVAQVVAAAGIAGGTSVLAVAVPVKLARVVLMAPVVAGISLVQRHRLGSTPHSTRPPIIPLFVAGFIAMVILATTGWVPVTVLGIAKILQQFFLATAMFALGLGVHIKTLMKLGAKPVLLGLCATLVIMAVVLAGIALGGGAHLA